MLETEDGLKAYGLDGMHLIAQIRTTIGALLRKERLAHQQSLEEVAAIIEWSPKKLENMELGKRHLNLHRLAQLLKLYGKELRFCLKDKR